MLVDPPFSFVLLAFFFRFLSLILLRSSHWVIFSFSPTISFFSVASSLSSALASTRVPSSRHISVYALLDTRGHRASVNARSLGSLPILRGGFWVRSSKAMLSGWMPSRSTTPDPVSPTATLAPPAGSSTKILKYIYRYIFSNENWTQIHEGNEGSNYTWRRRDP